MCLASYIEYTYTQIERSGIFCVSMLLLIERSINRGKQSGATMSHTAHRGDKQMQEYIIYMYMLCVDSIITGYVV